MSIGDYAVRYMNRDGTMGDLCRPSWLECVQAVPEGAVIIWMGGVCRVDPQTDSFGTNPENWA